mmetsp:Transcript_2663/g.4542  ORF Transcript_2663/g.4542 Transcript_2663/m.4542 type:complete len:82 (+) Transcript_2663:576-821(+)
MSPWGTQQKFGMGWQCSMQHSSSVFLGSLQMSIPSSQHSPKLCYIGKLQHMPLCCNFDLCVRAPGRGNGQGNADPVTSPPL